MSLDEGLACRDFEGPVSDRKADVIKSTMKSVEAEIFIDHFDLPGSSNLHEVILGNKSIPVVVEDAECSRTRYELAKSPFVDDTGVSCVVKD